MLHHVHARIRRLLSSVVLGLGAACLLLWVIVMGIEERMIYFPEPGGDVRGPGQDVELRASDGVRLHARHITTPGARTTLLFLHGNAGNLAGRSGVLQLLASVGSDVLALDYRGYGRSEGVPSEAGLYRDALAAHDWLTERVPAESIIVLGESLGGGVACELARTRPVGGLVLLSTFTSIRDMARLSFPALLPLHLFVRTRFDNLAKIPSLGMPKLFIHSRADELIPFWMAERLYAAAPPPRTHLWLQRSGHNDAFVLERKAVLGELSNFLAEAGPPAPP